MKMKMDGNGLMAYTCDDHVRYVLNHISTLKADVKTEAHLPQVVVDTVTIF